MSNILKAVTAAGVRSPRGQARGSRKAIHLRNGCGGAAWDRDWSSTLVVASAR